MWSIEDKVRFLARLPWTVSVERDAEDGHFVARVAELPMLIATGEDEATIQADLWSALKTTVRGLLHFGDAVPLPGGVGVLPWQPGFAAPAAETHTASVNRDGWENSRAQSTINTSSGFTFM